MIYKILCYFNFLLKIGQTKKRGINLSEPQVTTPIASNKSLHAAYMQHSLTYS